MADQDIVRRNRPGTKRKDMYSWPNQDFSEMESTLSVQQYIQQQIRTNYKDIDSILEPPAGQDEGAWKYEHLRQFCNEMNGLAVCLQMECDPKVCVQMTATEQWIFLCAAHKNPKECSAIDYTLHTLHGAASLLNSNKHFPSRLSIKDNSLSKLSSVARRIYRIFSHAYFHHRKLYEEFEEETYLCRRFTAYVTEYKLMSPENLNVPITGINNNNEDEDDAIEDDIDDDNEVDEESLIMVAEDPDNESTV